MEGALMSILNRIFPPKNDYSPMDERIVWGIWCCRRLQFAYKVFATDLRVPISVLACHVLQQWITQNCDSLLNDKNKKLEFADYLAKKYLSKEDN
jgi:hypothetical protein